MEEDIPGVVGILVMGAPTAYLFWLYYLSISSHRWPSTIGKITWASIEKPHNPVLKNKFQYRICYEYEVDGRMFEGSRVRFGGALEQGDTVAYSTVRRYEGRNPRIYHHPRWPSISTLEQSASSTLLSFLLPGLFITGSIIYGLITE